jgi:tellurite resistance protein
MIIFGSKGRITRSRAEDVLKKACVKCNGDLVLSDLKKWFTLYFLPVFPYEHIDTLYHCQNCDNTYRKEFKNMMHQDTTERKRLQDDIQKTYITTMAACMVHIAKSDGKITKDELAEIQNLKKGFPKYKKDIDSIVSKVRRSKDDAFVLQMLQTTSNMITAEGASMMIASIARVLLADGKIDPNEEKIMKNYIKVMGMPASVYGLAISRVKEAMKNSK